MKSVRFTAGQILMCRPKPILATLILAAATTTLWAQEVAEFVFQASKLIERHELEEAVSLLEKGLERHPDTPELLLQLGGLLIHVGEVERGQRLLETALRIDPFNAEILKQSAEAQLRQGRLTAAAELFRKALWHRSRDADSHHRLAFTLFLQGKEADSLAHARRSVELAPLSSQYRRFLSLLLDLDGQPEESLQQLRMAFRLEPENPSTIYQLSRRERRRGNLGQAIEFADLASGLDPENPLYLEELASLYAQIGQTEEAHQLQQRAEGLQNAFQIYFRALGLNRKGQIDQAIDDLEKTAGLQPEFLTGKMLLADLYYTKGRTEQALRLYSEILERDPSRVKAREESAWIHASRGSLDVALELLRDSSRPSLNQALLEGYQLALRKDWTAALDQFNRVLAENPLNTALLQLISYCLSELGETDLALQHLAKARSLEPRDEAVEAQIEEIQLNRAVGFQEQRKWGSAIQIYRSLLDQGKPQPIYYLNLAYCRQQLGQLEEAIVKYREGLRIDPQAHWARINLASCLYLRHRFEEAAREWEQVVKTDKTAENYLQLGLCYSQMGQDPEAELMFEKALGGGGDSAELFYNLGVTRLRLMKVQEAWALIRKAARMGYPPAQELVRKARSVR